MVNERTFGECQAVIGYDDRGEEIYCRNLTVGRNEFCDDHGRNHDIVTVARDDRSDLEE